MPSAPISTSPVSVVPSANVTVTESASCEGVHSLAHVHTDRAVGARLRPELEDPLVQAHQQIQAVHVVEAGVVVDRRVVIDRLARDVAVLPDLARLAEDRRAAAVDRPVGTLRITAVEVDAEPPAQPCAVRGDVQAGARGARRPRLLVDVDRREHARLPQRQSGHQPRHATTCDKRPHEVPPVPLRGSAPPARAAHAAGDCSSEQSGGQVARRTVRRRRSARRRFARRQ